MKVWPRIGIVVVLAGLAPSACGGRGAHGPSPSSPLVGTWRSRCTPIGKQGRHGAVFAVELDAHGRMRASTEMFARADCLEPTMRLAATAEYTVGAPIGSGIAIDYAFSAFDLTLLAQDVVEVYRKPEFAGCAKGEWRVGEPQSVLAGFCPPARMPAGGAIHRDTVFREGDTVSFGFLPLGLEDALGSRRPTAPSPVVFARAAQPSARK